AAAARAGKANLAAGATRQAGSVLSDPIVALATPPGRSAIAVIRVSGTGAFDVVGRCLRPFHADRPRAALRARLVHPATHEQVDDVIAAAFPAPRSYTGEDVVEISTHGGLLIPGEAVAALVAAGARPAQPGEFTRRALLNGKLDLLQAEATADLIDAGAPAQRRRALRQLERGLSGRLEALRSELLEFEALIAYDIDFPEEDEGPVSPARVTAAWRAVRERIAALLATAPEGERLREGALLVIAGPPNAGKSSLFFALLGQERAIVPGTSVTIARSWPSSGLKRDDLPALGGPAITSSAPSRRRSPSGAVASRAAIRSRTARHAAVTRAGLTGPSSSS